MSEVEQHPGYSVSKDDLHDVRLTTVAKVLALMADVLYVRYDLPVGSIARFQLYRQDGDMVRAFATEDERD